MLVGFEMSNKSGFMDISDAGRVLKCLIKVVLWTFQKLMELEMYNK